MKNQNGKPVIFLAFANDHQSYLYKLTEEQDGIRTALENAEREGLCEVVYETDTDVDKIFRVFDKYQDRIAVFHYGGHAEDYTLLLKAADGSRQYANSDGLTAFLAAQKGLQLVFINGCCSKQQAEKLRNLGVPAVVGTAQPIDDAAATILSTQFYESLAAGRTIAQSWQAAEAKVKTRTDAAVGYRAVWPGHAKKNEGRISFPWELYICPGAEKVEDWNLPRASKNPLFGLPLPKKYYANLPPAPFLGLNYFQEDDAALFFGRGAQIRALHSHIDGVHPIILFYGKSGVGKSSLLYAGLLPRIKDQFNVIYCRRNQELGLLGTLKKELGADVPNEEKISEKIDQRQESLRLLGEWKTQLPDKVIAEQVEKMLGQLKDAPSTQPIAAVDGLPEILKQWQAIEAGEGKPLIVILDQVEEHYTRPMDEGEGIDELGEFLDAIQPLFGSAAGAIQGKLILSYRKEYHPEIRDTFQDKKLPYAEVFLKRLDREGVVEAITGVTKDANIQAKYRLEISPNSAGSLPETLAEDLLADQESPIAPVLQIILKKLWESANEKNEDAPRFTSEQYQQLKKDGISMGEFFEQQMALLEADMPKAVASGLALDLLKHHTTDLGTAGRCSQAQLETYYSKRLPTIKKLIDKCIEYSLILRIDKNNTVLAHDILAPVVIREFNISDRPGQKAMRVLANRSHGWKDGNTGELLDRQDMTVLAAGAEGRRDLNTDEERMLAASEKAQLQRRRQLQRRIAAAAVGPMLIAAFAWLIFQYNSAYLGMAKPEYEWTREEIHFFRGEPFKRAVTTGFFTDDIRSQKKRSDAEASINIGFGERTNWSPLVDYLKLEAVGFFLVKTGNTQAGVDSLLLSLQDMNREDSTALKSVLAEAGSNDLDIAKRMLANLENQDSEVDSFRLEILVEIRKQNTEFVKSLLEMFDKNDSTKSSCILEIIGEAAVGTEKELNLVVDAAKDENLMIRRTAIKVLGVIGGSNTAAIDVLIGATQDKDSEIRMLAISAMRYVNTESTESIDAVIVATRDEDAYVREAAVEVLGVIAHDNTDAIEAVIVVTKDEGEAAYVREAAVKALGIIGRNSTAAIDALIGATKDKNEYVRASAKSALGGIQNENGVALVAVKRSSNINALIKKLNEEDYSNSVAAWDTLLHMIKNQSDDTSGLTDVLILNLKNENQNIRKNATRAFGHLFLENPDAIDAPLNIINDSDEYVRKKFASDLGDIGAGNAAAVNALINMLDDNNKAVCQEAVIALGKIGAGNNAVVNALINTLDDNNKDVRTSAVLSLGAMGKENTAAKMALVNMLDRKTLTVDISQVFKAFTSVADVDSFPVDVVVTKLKDEKSSVRISAVNILSEMKPGNVDVLNSLIAALDDEDINVRKAALRALGKVGVGNEKVLKAVIAVSGEEENDVRFSAITALGEIGIGSPEVVDILIKALKKENKNVAIRSLKKIGTGSDAEIEAWIDLLDDENWEVRRDAVSALGKIASNNDVATNVLFSMVKDRDGAVNTVVSQTFANLINTKEYVALTAVNSLVEVFQKKSVDELLEMLQEYDSGYRYIAAILLARKAYAQKEVLEKISELKNNGKPWVRMSAWDAGYLINKRERSIALAEHHLKEGETGFADKNFVQACSDWDKALGILTVPYVGDSLMIAKTYLKQAHCQLALRPNNSLEEILVQAFNYHPALRDSLKNSVQHPAIIKAIEDIGNKIVLNNNAN